MLLVYRFKCFLVPALILHGSRNKARHYLHHHAHVCCWLVVAEFKDTCCVLLQVCEGTDAVARNARSHSALLSGVFIGDATSLVRLKFVIESSTREVAMHVTVRSDTVDASELVHQMIQDA